MSMMRLVAIITMIMAVAACTPPVTKGPRNLNDALLDANQDWPETNR